MKAIIAEKPSVAREIAKVLHVQNRKDGYLHGNGYCVTWALGHLIELGMPQDYGIPNFDPAVLPIVPSPFRLIPRTQKKTKGSLPDPLAVKQLKVIREVLDQCDSIIVATDAGREGELIFRYIYQYLECAKPFERLWISSLTEKAISEGFRNLQAGNNYNSLYQAAKARSEADWLVGINASQALTIAGGGETYSLGRVQTPTLALICQRFQDNQQFKKQKFYQIQLKHRKDYLDFTSLSIEQWQDQKQAEKIRASIEREGRAVVEDVQNKTVTEAAPLLYDLTALQKDANRKLGMTADEVLKIAQSLYEKQFITYPRTGSPYIPEDLWPEIPELVRVLKNDPQFTQPVNHLRFGNFNKRIVNDVKVTDHHGILNTHKLPSALSASEKSIYHLIAFRLLESLSEPCIREVSLTLLKVHHYGFQIKGATIRSKGWRSIRGLLSDDPSLSEEAPINELPAFNTGDVLKISHAEILQKSTQAPKLYTEADLLSAMEHAGNLTTGKDQKQILQNIGIGTPATRAAIIETLIRRSYITRKNKSLQPTDKGLNVYNLTKDQLISNVQMTADWELALQRIEQNELAPDEFLQHIQKYTTEITQELLSLKIHGEEIPSLTCPKCKAQPLIITDKIIKCPDEHCNWIQFRTICGVKLSLSDITALITTSQTPLIKNMKAKSGKKFNATLVLTEQHKTVFEFPQTELYKYHKINSEINHH
ncbi:DNA topoisomerase-3 [Chryseobacterium vietnamense]|uniref:type IA DNA topoisomerase n=1 Tax=Chryseobacterium vietnamense TaxID=866785 RepID=UPI0028571ACF|nr:DNA topoisomerase III [Chryseobacterium vietnamense]MDR6487228.1 DNA topoisomerase-3 [Chryseobacterium vietnamense]